MKQPPISLTSPVRINAQGLVANPEFAGLVGQVQSAYRSAGLPTLSIYFPRRGATTCWAVDHIENVPDAR